MMNKTWTPLLTSFCGHLQRQLRPRILMVPYVHCGSAGVASLYLPHQKRLIEVSTFFNEKKHPKALNIIFTLFFPKITSVVLSLYLFFPAGAYGTSYAPYGVQPTQQVPSGYPGGVSQAPPLPFTGQAQPSMPPRYGSAMGGYPQTYTIGPQGVMPPSPGHLPQKSSFKGMTETYPMGAQNWSQSVTSTLDVKGKKVTILGPFAGTKGKEGISKTFSLKGASDFKVQIDFWTLRSWDDEVLSVFFNQKSLAQFKFNNTKEFHYPKCTILEKDIPLTTPRWLSRKIRCTFEGSLKSDKMTIENQEVTDPNTPDNLTIGFGSNLNSPTSDEALGIEQIKIIPKNKGNDLGTVPRRINITVLSPYPVAGTPGIPGGQRPPLLPGSQNTPPPGFGVPSSPAPGRLSGAVDPQYYIPSMPPSSTGDLTAGFVTDGMARQGASKCAICQSPNPEVRNTEFCLKNCVVLPRQTILNMDRENDVTREENRRLKRQLEDYKRKLGTASSNPPIK